jgi:hypothetical protein
MVKRLPLALFVLSVVACSFVAGLAVAILQPYPFPQVSELLRDVRGTVRNWRTELGIRPPLSNFFPPPQDREGQHAVVARREPGMQDGETLLSGLFDNAFTLRLVDREGTPLNTWRIDPFTIFPNLDHVQPERLRPHHKWSFLVHGFRMFPDGSVVFNITNVGMVKMDRCSNVQWALPRMTHHSVFLADDGTLWVPGRIFHDEPPAHLAGMRRSFYEETILQVSPEGQVMQEISVLDLLIHSELKGLLGCPGREEFEGCAFESNDPTHVNDVEVLTARDAAAIRGTAPGDLLVSARNLNLVMIFDPHTSKIKWWQVGPWRRQHDPDLLPGGIISIYNNNRDNSRGAGPRASNIIRIDPNTNAWEVTYPKGRDDAFYSDTAGNHQYLPNGNVLITESGARVLEVDPGGRVVWEYLNWYDDNKLAYIVEAQRYVASDLQVKDWSCPVP